MSALCGDCGWTGTSTEVDYGGLCPICRTKVNYTSGPVSNVVAATTIRSFGEFASRAFDALASCSLNSWDAGFFESVRSRPDGLEEGERNNLLRLVLRHDRAIDSAVVDYAADHAPRVTA